MHAVELQESSEAPEGNILGVSSGGVTTSQSEMKEFGGLELAALRGAAGAGRSNTM